MTIYIVMGYDYEDCEILATFLNRMDAERYIKSIGINFYRNIGIEESEISDSYADSYDELSRKDKEYYNLEEEKEEKPLRCYICGHTIAPDEENPLYRRTAKHKLKDGKIVNICEKCWREIMEAQVNERYKLMGRKDMKEHNKHRKELGLW